MTKFFSFFCLPLVCLLAIAWISAFAEDFAAASRSESFATACGQPPGVEVESGSITITDIAEPVPVSIINGEYSINGFAYTAEPGMVSFGQTLSVRHVAATGDETMKSSILNVGGMRVTFTSSTEPCLRGTR